MCLGPLNINGWLHWCLVGWLVMSAAVVGGIAQEEAAGQHAADMLALRISLILGTDGESPQGVKYEPVDPALAQRFRKVFRWKNYFVIRQKEILVSSRAETTVQMSEKCTLKVILEKGSMLEVALITEGKVTKRVRHPIQVLKQGELLVLAGEDTNNFEDAWFVVIASARSYKQQHTAP